MNARLRALRQLSPFALVAIMLAGCSDGTAPGGGPQSGDLALGGSFDADGETFLLGVTDTLPGNPLVVELIGGGLVLDPEDEEVSLQVAIRNVGADIHPPVMIWLGDFVPGSVSVVNPDAVAVSGGLADILPPAYGFDYSELLGEDGVLASGETSRSKPWIFHDPGLASFAFGARLDAGLAPGLARLGGRVWVDRNGNGQLRRRRAGLARRADHGGDARRRGAPGLQRPRGPLRPACRDRGALSGALRLLDLRHAAAALHDAESAERAHRAGRRAVSRRASCTPTSASTGAPGRPSRWSSRRPHPSRCTWRPGRSSRRGSQDDALGLQVGFSGCQPEHPWTLYICGGFMESNPVQVRAVLVHELEEECDAAFTRVLPFSLHPLRMAYEMAYGSGTLLIQLVDFQGQVHTIEYYVRGKDEGK